jgi:hypothetical protein
MATISTERLVIALQSVRYAEQVSHSK